ncbi:hypothetical protein CCMA1212_007917 [Trichoderma ghanense]|uniref:Uncharacterized protein n=1 Tax=Trichoderma ghanense TaxID=65468 RepID=A0ABY2GXZ8_9HYPO
MVADQATGSGRCQKRSLRPHRNQGGQRRVPALGDCTAPGSSLVELVWSFEMCLPKGQRGTGEHFAASHLETRACVPWATRRRSDKRGWMGELRNARMGDGGDAVCRTARPACGPTQHVHGFVRMLKMLPEQRLRPSLSVSSP